MSDVSGLGSEGDVVKVKDGYARNYLLPRKLAAPVTEATRRQLEKRRKERDAQMAGQRATAVALKERIEQTSCTISVKTGAEGKLFGSVTAQDVVATLQVQGIDLDKHQLELAEPIRETGVFSVTAKLHPQVQATVKVWVVEE